MDFLGVRRGEFETMELGRYPRASFFHMAWRIYGASMLVCLWVNSVERLSTDRRSSGAFMGYHGRFTL